MKNITISIWRPSIVVTALILSIPILTIAISVFEPTGENWQHLKDNVLKEYQLKNELSVPEVNQPIRIALTGSTKSPGLGLTLSIFTKNKAIERINKLLDKLS